MKINVPKVKVGVFVSGGLDSAILYYLMLKENQNIVPLLVFKNTDQRQYAANVIDYVQSQFGLHQTPLLLKSKNIRQAVSEAAGLGFDLVYVGVIKELDEFLVGWESNNFNDTGFCRGPLKHLDKSEIVGLIRKNNLEQLFSITHSCATQSQGRCLVCNRCRERAWGFSQLDLTDPGTL